MLAESFNDISLKIAKPVYISKDYFMEMRPGQRKLVVRVLCFLVKDANLYKYRVIYPAQCVQMFVARYVVRSLEPLSLSFDHVTHILRLGLFFNGETHCSKFLQGIIQCISLVQRKPFYKTFKQLFTTT